MYINKPIIICNTINDNNEKTLELFNEVFISTLTYKEYKDEYKLLKQYFEYNYLITTDKNNRWEILINICTSIVERDTVKLNNKVNNIDYGHFFIDNRFENKYLQLIGYLCDKKYNEEMKILINNDAIFDYLKSKPLNPFGYDDNILDWMENVCLTSCKRGNLEIVKWAYETEPKININNYYYDTFSKVCEKGYTDIVKYILEIEPNTCVTVSENYPFMIVCRYGYLDIAKILYKHNPTTLTYNLGKNYYNCKQCDDYIDDCDCYSCMTNYCPPLWENPLKAAVAGNQEHIIEWLRTFEEYKNIKV